MILDRISINIYSISLTTSICAGSDDAHGSCAASPRETGRTADAFVCCPSRRLPCRLSPKFAAGVTQQA